ncbi:methyltransferase domain-containing protein [Egibacter rhizosphaerae]|uniref:Methyltransferase domain-containing protein n=1 Tax=Egibacter rhizosphaerae TaxID=1670831 RepID=A0A411YEE5_9ACTN|nr:rRNA adenine N(6)-methyltransferase family protein [Egibacter rhizosphaerae]QBI19571.1 methyltransferase domain-containing protein [Egibacter rhizosphaerae]
MGGRKRHTSRDARRRTHGQSFLVRQSVVREFLARAELAPGERVVEFGAGTGALTVPLATTGARVIAVERDPAWARQLRERVRAEGLHDRVEVVRADLRAYALPRSPYRVVSSPPFALTTDLMRRLCDDPDRGPERADLLVQHEVAVKRAAEPPATLQSSAWAPWWTFELGPVVPRQAFRPVPRVDGAWLTVRKREPPVLPTRLAPGFREVLRPAWETGR